MNDFTAIDISTVLKIHKKSVERRARMEAWPYTETLTRGGKQRRYALSGLPEDVQTILASRYGIADKTPEISVNAALAAETTQAAEALVPVSDGEDSYFPSEIRGSSLAHWNDSFHAGPAVIQDDRVMRIARILAEAEAVPPNWRARAWVESVAERYDISFQTIYKWRKKYGRSGLVGLKHTKPNKGQATAWDDEALEWWIGLCMKNDNRKRSMKYLYNNVLVVEAARRGWRIGAERSALAWAKKRITPQLKAYQKGGIRALDNILPPVLRDYSDLAPFEILVGDQHRFDFWVCDDLTGEVFRPEGYFWQDLRTRAFYGGALDRKYDSHLMGLALRIGMRAHGAFGTIYNDHGRPERSKYIMSILRDVRSLGLGVERTVDGPETDDEGEEVQPAVKVGRRWAIVRNAKAKMIEGTFHFFEQLLRDAFGVPGYVKKLGGSQEENEIDQAEIQRLASAGKLLTFSEFLVTVFKAMDYYNRVRPHTGVLREWAWRPRPKTATPYDCLAMCCKDGWKPRPVDPETLDLIFLPRGEPIVTKGRIAIQKELYEHDSLIRLEKKRVEVRYDPMDPTYVIVFYNGEYVCRAEIAERGSMIDDDKTSRLVRRKRRLRREQIEEYRRLTSGVPDTRVYSKVSAVERAAALAGRERRQKAAEREELYRQRTPEELQAEVASLEARAAKPARKNLPERPKFFLSKNDRYAWCLKFQKAGGDLSDEDRTFASDYEATMNAEEREYWEAKRIYG